MTGNSASSNGGALYLYHGLATLSGCTISLNSAQFLGGGIFSFGTLDIVPLPEMLAVLAA